MLNIILCFILAAVISFVGSILPGPVNLQVIRISHLKSVRAGIIVAAGGSLPELIYVALALVVSFTWADSRVWIHYSHLIFTLTLALLSVFFGFKRERTTVNDGNSRNSSHFLSGFVLGLLNPLLFPFWVFMINYVQSFNIIEVTTPLSRIAFTLGSVIGAFLVLALWAGMTTFLRSFIIKTSISINKIVSVILFSLALLELFKFLHSS